MISKVQKMEITELPEDIQHFFFSLPQFREAIKIAGEKTTTQKSLKAATRASKVRKGVVMPFASILRDSVKRDVGTPLPPLKVAPAQAVQSIAGANPETPPSAGKPTTLGRASNTSKTPIPSKHEPMSFQDLRSAIDSALHERAHRERHEAFNETRSAFSRLAPTRKSDVEGGGLGSAHALRNLGGKLAASILNASTRKGDNKPVGSSALDVAFGRR